MSAQTYEEAKTKRQIDQVLWFIFKLLVFAIIFLFGSLWYFSHNYENVQLPRQFQSWCKHTGNPGQLTFDEWLVLPKHYK